MNAAMNAPMSAADRSAHLEALYARALYEAARQLALSEGEARCILDVCLGRWPSDQLGQNLRAEMQSALQSRVIPTKWEIDAASLVQRLRKLPGACTAALEVWVMEWVDWSTAAIDDPGWGPDWEAKHMALVVLPPSRKFSASKESAS